MSIAFSIEHAGVELFPEKVFEAFMFDMDGTLLTSIGSSERVWAKWAARYGLNASDFLPTCHGMRVAEVIDSLGLSDVDSALEAQRILEAELADVTGIEAIAGARTFLETLPSNRWAVVTSAPRVLAVRRLTVAGLPIPPVLITGDDVESGKPDPSCFLAGAARLHVTPEQCVVFEDAPVGICAGNAAGCSVVVLSGTQPEICPDFHPSIPNYSRLVIR